MITQWVRRLFYLYIFLSFLSFLLGFFTGCNNQDGSDLPPERPIFSANGYGVDAVITGATIEVFSWANGTKGEKLGQGTTDAAGYYAIGLQAPNQPVLLELSDGRYIEEASGKQVSLLADQRLYALTYYSGAELTVMVTPITTLAAGLAQYLADIEDYNAENAITFAVSAITGIFDVNCLETYPINITDQTSHTNELTDGHLYGFYAAAISSWTTAICETNGRPIHTTYNSIYLSQLMYNDIVHDGALDGIGTNLQGEEIPLYMGSVALDAQVYRQMIGHHLIVAADFEYNITGLGVADIIDQARVFSQRTNAIFANIPPLALDNEGPQVFQTEPLENITPEKYSIHST